MLLGVVLLLATATPAPGSTIKILVLDIKAESINTETTRALRDEVTVELSRAPQLSVLSTEDLRAAVSIEAETRALGCDTTSCLAEIGAALGARYVVHGSVANIGGTYVVYLNLFDTDKNEALARESVDAPSLAGLLPAIRGGAARVRERVAASKAAPAATLAADEVNPVFVGAAIGAGLGAAATVVGGVFLIGSYFTVTNLEEDVAVREQAQGTGLVASVVTGVGVLVLAAGATVATMQVME